MAAAGAMASARPDGGLGGGGFGRTAGGLGDGVELRDLLGSGVATGGLGGGGFGRTAGGGVGVRDLSGSGSAAGSST